ncbi:hypothetical protein [Halanaeroarchaeum sulfurireducens]|uniref:hypothetical protein n=1 Tax=Halanaeroarchaeum sulfurireducens TaxID=1604004 RepID=UPI0011875522|nr:hypothetical protein [Halanaeroarchaeum sulfurireducens]
MSTVSSLSGPRGWLIVGLVVVALLGIPAVLWYLTTGMRAGYGVYVALAMVPALLFGAIGVWTALRHRQTP